MIIDGVIVSDEDGVIAPDNLFGPALVGEMQERFNKNVLAGKILLYRSVVGIERELEVVAIPEVVDFGEGFFVQKTMQSTFSGANLTFDTWW